MENLVFLCLGTTKISGDSIGPKVGDRLKQMNIGAYVYGDTRRQVTSINVEDYAAMLKKRHSGDRIIAVDSALGKSADIGKIKITDAGVKPGGAFNKTRERVGDMGILAVVGDSEKDRLDQLRNSSSELVDELVEKVVGYALTYAGDMRFL